MFNKINVVILAGGLGSRLSEETKKKPKPMVRIGNRPILWHIIKIFITYGFKNFFLASGYKGEEIQKYFNKFKFEKSIIVKTVNTGKKSMTGGRILKLKKFFNKNEDFVVTYGDGVANVNLKKLLEFHKKKKRIATITIVRPPARWGHVTVNNSYVTKFQEKNQLNEGWINGGFFVFNHSVFQYFKKGSKTILEEDVLPLLSKHRQLVAYKHHGFWQCMDTLRDKLFLNKLWKKNPDWKIW
jgi:glucose-1-phosphate cytidylyltransferase